MTKKAVKLIKQRDFWFILIIYPLLFIASDTAVEQLMPIAIKYPVYYILCVFIMLLIIVTLTTLEVFKRLFMHELQGDKLKIREKEGISIEE